MALMLADQKGRFLYECRPDLFPVGYLTPVECELWGLYYEDKSKKR